MILTEVGEYGDVEGDACAPSEGQRMRRDLHHAGDVARVGHSPEGRLEVDRLRGRAAGFGLDPADDLHHRPDQPGPPAGRFEDVPQQDRSRGLPVGPGYAGDREFTGWMIVEGHCDLRHRRPGVRNDDLRNPETGRSLADKGDRPGRNGIRSEVVSVEPLAGHTEEE